MTKPQENIQHISSNFSPKHLQKYTDISHTVDVREHSGWLLNHHFEELLTLLS